MLIFQNYSLLLYIVFQNLEIEYVLYHTVCVCIYMYMYVHATLLSIKVLAMYVALCLIIHV